MQAEEGAAAQAQRVRENSKDGRVTREERMVLALMRQALAGGPAPSESDVSWGEIIRIAQRHAVLPMLSDMLFELKDGPGRELLESVRETALHCVRQNVRLAWETARTQKALEKAGISTAVLKGGGIGVLYPVPEYRKSGDVDLFLLRQQADGKEQQLAILAEQVKQAGKVFTTLGYFPDHTHPSSNHMVYQNADGIRLELHTFLMEPVDDESVNQKIWEIQRSGVLRGQTVHTAGQELTALTGAGQAFALLLHMLNHFLRAGFGLKLLADWTVFWNQIPQIEKQEQEIYQSLAEACGLGGFSDLVTTICVRYLGLKGLKPQQAFDPALADAFLRDILASGEFGADTKGRMVALRGIGLKDYFREFHHRTKLNFPQASAYPILYPVLWLRTLFRFLINNWKIRGISARTILRQAGERGQFIRQIHLFEK